MEQWRGLPARERALPGESLASLLRRTAAAMGYDNVNLITRLLGDSYKPHQNPNWVGPGPHLDRLAVLLRLSPDLLHWTAAVDVLQSWPERLYQFLDEFQRVAKNQVLSTGVSRSFGLLLRDAARLEGLGYSVPAHALRRYLLERYTGGHVNRWPACASCVRLTDTQRTHDLRNHML